MDSKQVKRWIDWVGFVAMVALLGWYAWKFGATNKVLAFVGVVFGLFLVQCIAEQKLFGDLT